MLNDNDNTAYFENVEISSAKQKQITYTLPRVLHIACFIKKIHNIIDVSLYVVYMYIKYVISF